jgi:hypothetical protein
MTKVFFISFFSSFRDSYNPGGCHQELRRAALDRIFNEEIFIASALSFVEMCLRSGRGCEDMLDGR